MHHKDVGELAGLRMSDEATTCLREEPPSPLFTEVGVVCLHRPEVLGS
jgi:hypothetical protein